MKYNTAISHLKRTFVIITLLINSLQILSAQRISSSKERKLQGMLQCANVALLQGERQVALDIYKEIRNNGRFSQTALIANDSLALNSYDNLDIETLYDCIKYSDNYLRKFPIDKRMQEKKEDYLTLYYEIRNNLEFQDDLCGIWVSDYTEDKHKAPYLILEIERVGNDYIAHIHPTCQMSRKYPTYQYWGKYKFYESSQLPFAKCGGDWETDSVFVHFADKTYQKASRMGSQMAAGAGVQLVEFAKQTYTDLTSDPDFFRQPDEFRYEVYGTTLAVAGVGVALSILSSVLQNAKVHGYSILFKGKYMTRGIIECRLTEEVLEIASSGKSDDKYKEISMRMLKIYPDYDVRFIGYNNWLVGSHTFTNTEANNYPEHKYKKQKILQHNTESYNRLFMAFNNSH